MNKFRFIFGLLLVIALGFSSGVRAESLQPQEKGLDTTVTDRIARHLRGVDAQVFQGEERRLVIEIVNTQKEFGRVTMLYETSSFRVEQLLLEAERDTASAQMLAIKLEHGREKALARRLKQLAIHSSALIDDLIVRIAARRGLPAEELRSKFLKTR